MSFEIMNALIDQIDEKVQNLELENQRLKQELSSLEQEKETYRRAVETLENRLYLIECADQEKIPAIFDTWHVRLTDKGYVELFKEMPSGMRTLHIGKKWDPEKARKKIAETEDLPRMVLLSANLVSGSIIPFCSRDCCQQAGYSQKPENIWVDYDPAYPNQCAHCGKKLNKPV